MITAGIDMGSRTVKVVLLEDVNVEGAPQLKYEVKKTHIMMPGDLDPDQAAEKVYDDVLLAAGLTRDQVTAVFATGAGRKQVAFATEGITEMTAGAKGASFMFPQGRTVVDVGAEEGRGMKTDAQGRAIDFAGNEKCAAGAGSFAEAMSRALQMTLKEFGDASLLSDKSIPMNAQCTVFAESEDEVKATIVLQENASVTAEELCGWSVDKLPYFAVPRYFEFRSDLPRSPVGRVLKYELRDEGVTEATWDREAAGFELKKR